MNRNTFRPQLESLDGRLVPAIVSINLGTGVAIFSGNSANDTITITDRGTGGMTVTSPSLAQPVSLLPSFTHIVINGYGGNDTVTYQLTGTQRRSVTIDANLGTGNDRFTANQNGNDVRNNSNEIINVSGAQGADRIAINAAGTDGNRVNIGSGSSLQLRLTGGSNVDLSDASDVIAVDYQGVLDGNLRMRQVGGFGGDSLRAAITLDNGSDGFVRGFSGARAGLEGGFGADTLDFRVRDNSGGTGHVSALADAGLDLDADIVRHTANVLSAFTFGDDDQVVA